LIRSMVPLSRSAVSGKGPPWLSADAKPGCVTLGSEGPPSACPPVVAYSDAEQARVAEEVAALPEGARIVSWLADYAVLRAQVRTCSS